MYASRHAYQQPTAILEKHDKTLTLHSNMSSNEDKTLDKSRKLPHIYDKDYQSVITAARQLICTGGFLEKKQRKSGLRLGGNWKRRNLWVPSQGREGLKIIYWIQLQRLCQREYEREELAMRLTRKELLCSDICRLSTMKKRRSLLFMMYTMLMLARKTEKETKLVAGASNKGRSQYLLEFSGIQQQRFPSNPGKSYFKSVSL